MDLKEYVFRYVDCDSFDGVCLALGFFGTVFCWRKYVQCKKKIYWMGSNDCEFYYYKCLNYAHGFTDVNYVQSKKLMFCNIYHQVGVVENLKNQAGVEVENNVD